MTNSKSSDMNHEEERLKTFENWPSDLVSPKFLAQNGFYFLKRKNDVRCAFCKLELSCAAGNDPVKDHKHWAPQCPLFNRQSSKSSRESPVGRDECGPYASTSSGGNLPGPTHSEYASEVGRLRTFKHWPRSMRQKPEDLAEAGFYYTGTGDRSKCFYCNGGISDWEVDDVPWKEHARLLSRCPYVHLVKGREYVQKVITESCALPTESDTKVSYEKKSLKHMLGDNKNNDEENIDDSNLCRICYAEERNVCFVPCGHVVCCAKCALSTNKCPMCRRVFHNAVRLYFS